MPNCSEGAFGPSTAGSQRTAGSLKMDSSLLVLVIAFRSMRLLGVSIPLDPRRARKTSTVKGSPQEIHTKGVGNRRVLLANSSSAASFNLQNPLPNGVLPLQCGFLSAFRFNLFRAYAWTPRGGMRLSRGGVVRRSLARAVRRLS